MDIPVWRFCFPEFGNLNTTQESAFALHLQSPVRPVIRSGMNSPTPPIPFKLIPCYAF
jgi:hypothetical protein